VQHMFPGARLSCRSPDFFNFSTTDQPFADAIVLKLKCPDFQWLPCNMRLIAPFWREYNVYRQDNLQGYTYPIARARAIELRLKQSSSSSKRLIFKSHSLITGRLFCKSLLDASTLAQRKILIRANHVLRVDAE